MFVLHGILGSGQNFRTIARQLAEAPPERGLALVDLRFHGRSGARPGPQSLKAAADDLAELEARLPGRCVGVMGHSFGGKVAAVYASQREQSLQRLWILDSPPGARANGDGSESTLQILDMLERAPRHYPDRRAFVQHVQDHGQPAAIGQWLAMNLSRDGDGFALDLNIDAIRELLDDYFHTDMWPWIEQTRLPVTLVNGKDSAVWDDAQWRKARSLAETHEHVRLRVVPNAGHWLHADNPKGTIEALLADW